MWITVSCFTVGSRIKARIGRTAKRACYSGSRVISLFDILDH